MIPKNSKFIKTIKYKGEYYHFYITGIGKEAFIQVITPKNCFGYEDSILLDSENKAYQLYRNDISDYIIKKIEKYMISLKKEILSEEIKKGCAIE